ncbi:MAG: hypothetical protein JRH11_05610 [Deltaproteobacteria bacterium]|nr:hypothetical protein [Deltaproteobacteria bacterium]
MCHRQSSVASLVALGAFLGVGALTAIGCGPVPGGYGAEPAYGGAVSTTPGGIEVVEQPPMEAQAPAADNTVVTVEVFYEELAPYGTWSEVEPYGTVWAANDPDYAPYQDGYWEFTEYGFTWVAETEWGWATEHYGRWVWMTDQWVWVPDDEWGPAWVEWRDAETMVGWAPLGPDGWHTIPPVEHWVFVDVSMVLTHEVYHYYQPAPIVAALWGTSARVSWTSSPAGVAYCPGPSYRSLNERNVVVQRAPSSSVYVGRRPPHRAGAAGSSRPTVRVDGGSRPSVGVAGGARPRVSVDGNARPRVRVDGPGRPTVVLRPTRPLPRAGAAAAARTDWDQPRAIPRPRPETRVIGRHARRPPRRETPSYGREATNAEVQAAVARAQRYEQQRHLRPPPVRPVVPAPSAASTPGVTVQRRTPPPTAGSRFARPPVSPGAAIPASARPTAPPPRGPAHARPPTVQPRVVTGSPRFGPRPTVPRATAPRLPNPAAHQRHAPVTRPRAPAVRGPQPRVAAPQRRGGAPAAQRPSPASGFRSSPGVRVSPSSSNRRIARPAMRRATPTVRRGAAPPLGRPSVGTAVRRN